MRDGRTASRCPTIYSKHHFLISVLAGGVLAAVLGDTAVEMLAVVVYAGCLGVLIDLDHFLIARLNVGSWEPAVRVVRSPVRSLADQSTIFPDRAISREDRMLTHLLIAAGLVTAGWWVRPTWGLVTAVVLYLHLLTDAAADVFDLY